PSRSHPSRERTLSVRVNECAGDNVSVMRQPDNADESSPRSLPSSSHARTYPSVHHPFMFRAVFHNVSRGARQRDVHRRTMDDVPGRDTGGGSDARRMTHGSGPRVDADAAAATTIWRRLFSWRMALLGILFLGVLVRMPFLHVPLITDEGGYA